MVPCIRGQAHRLLAKCGVVFLPTLQIEIDAGTAALHQGLEDVIFERAGLFERFFRRLKTETPVGMQTEPAHSEKTVDLVADLSRSCRACDHFLEVSYRAGEISR